MWKNPRVLPFVPVLLGLKFKHWVLLGTEGGEGRVASLWCKCCANVVVPLITAYLVLGRDHSPSLCFTEPPLTNSSVHIIKVLHMRKSSLYFFDLYQILSLQVEIFRDSSFNFSWWKNHLQYLLETCQSACVMTAKECN